MKEQERCRTCLSGHFYPTLNPKELKCNYCGWTRIAMNLGDYVTYGGKVDNIHNVNLEPKPPFRNEFITTVPPDLETKFYGFLNLSLGLADIIY